jgi:hypothetical protein
MAYPYPLSCLGETRNNSHLIRINAQRLGKQMIYCLICLPSLGSGSDPNFQGISQPADNLALPSSRNSFNLQRNSMGFEMDPITKHK